MKDQINKRKNIVSAFFTEFIRFRGVFNWSAISFIGFILGMSSLNLTDYLIPFLVFLASAFCILSFTFAINNYYDIESDKRNPKKIHYNAMASGKISKKTGAALNAIFVIVPLIVSFLFKLEIFLGSLLLIFWMWIYSSPPLRLKGRPGLDIIWHFFAFVLLVMWGSLISGSLGLINWLVAISIAVFSCIAQILNHFHDYEFDKESGTETYAVRKGLDATKTALKIVIVLHFVSLIPLILLYSLEYFYTIAILILSVLLSLFLQKIKRDSLVTSAGYFPVILGFTVYLNCIIYHVSILLGEPTIGLSLLSVYFP